MQGGLGSCALAAYGRRLATAAEALFRGSPSIVAQVLELAAKLAAGGALSVVHDRAEGAAHRDRVAPFQRHYDALRSLAPGGFCVWDAGWLIPGGEGHAIVVVIGRDVDGTTGTLTVCNSGAGVQYHPVSVAAHPKTKYRTALHLGKIPWWRIDDDGFVYELLRPYVPGLADRTCGAAAAALYESLLPAVSRGGMGGHGSAGHAHVFSCTRAPHSPPRSSSPAATGRRR